MKKMVLIRLQLEYAVTVWDPHTKDKSSQIEKVAVLGCNMDCLWQISNFSTMIEALGWHSLEQRRALSFFSTR